MLTNGQGYEFEKHILEYFLLLFPCPELLFQLRVNWQKLRRALVEPVKRRRSTGDQVETEARSEANDGSAEYVAVPVHRQNCFIGALPGSALATAARQQNYYLQQRQQQQTTSGTLHQLRPETSQPHSEPKRLRFHLTTKQQRRSAPNAGPTASLLTAKRSIRI
ncbi:uncharacterized protein LOC111605298 isoform X2 [Drosophila hydei]|nr:uncharacterized protein LOC111605298 isoform X2 [Drosophila hydei]